MEGITLATFNEPSQAVPLKEHLDHSHIPAAVQDESTLKYLWFTTRHLASVKVRVHPADYEAAQRLAQVWNETDGVLHEAVHCPECGSSRVEYPQFTRWFFLPNIIGVLSGLGIIQKKAYCRSCQNVWLPSGEKPPGPPRHGAPYYFLEDMPPKEEETAERPASQSESKAKA